MDVLEELRALPPGDARARTDELCALGFALHLYGDSFSHQMIKNSAKLYHTGIGHLFDSAMPDLPLYSGDRLELWRRYLSSAAGLVSRADAPDLSGVLAAAADPRQTASRHNGYNEPGLRGLLASYLQAQGVLKSFVPFERSFAPKGCQALADRQSAANGALPAPSCERTWAVFSRFAVKEFEAYDSDPKHENKSRDPAYLKTPYFRGSPFSKGPLW